MKYIVCEQDPSTYSPIYECGYGYAGPLLKKAKLKATAYNTPSEAYNAAIALKQASGHVKSFTYAEYVNKETFMAAKNAQKKIKSELKSQVITLGGKQYTLENVAKVTNLDDLGDLSDGLDNWQNGDLDLEEKDMLLQLRIIDPLKNKTVIASVQVTADGIKSIADLNGKVQEGDTILVARDDGSDDGAEDEEDDD